MANQIKIAMAQLLVEGGVPKRNLERAQKMVIESANMGADLVVLPEVIDFAWTHPLGLKRSEPIPGPYSDFFIELASQNEVYICVGLTENEEGRNFNTALLISPNGEVLLKYRKINLLDVEFDFYQVGSKLEVIDLPWGRFGVNICSDNYIGSLENASCLSRMGAQVILSPCAWTVSHAQVEGGNPYADKWNKPLSYIAKTFNVVTVSCTSVGYIVGGPYEGMKMMGGSIIMGPSGVLQQARFNEFAGQLIVTEIEVPSPLRKGVEHGAHLKANPLLY